MPNLPVLMVRENLENIPEVSLPAGYSLRWFQKGDEKLWLKIHLAAENFREISAELFEREFGKNETALAQRQCFVIDKNENPIGTATAWFDDMFGDESFGRVHWVAVVSEEQGKGIGRCLTAMICRRLKQLGHTKAFLRTSTRRISAIGLYSQFGFTPLIRNADEEKLWNELLRKMKGRFRDV